MQQTWFITGASRGLGVEIAKAAMRNGDRVVATGRSRAQVADSLGPDDAQLLSLEHDVTDAAQTDAAVAAALKRFGSIDVLVNNAGYGHLGFFEETSDADAQAQFATNVFGLFNVTRSVLPGMRAAKHGRIFNISSIAGVRSNEFASLYCSSKFAVAGISEAVAKEVASFGIFVVAIVEPGPFRTDFLSQQSLRLGATQVSDYDTRRARVLANLQQRNGEQAGDPVKLANALVRLAREPKPPLHFLAGSFAYDTAQAKLKDSLAEYESWRDLSVGLDYDA